MIYRFINASGSWLRVLTQSNEDVCGESPIHARHPTEFFGSRISEDLFDRDRLTIRRLEVPSHFAWPFREEQPRLDVLEPRKELVPTRYNKQLSIGILAPQSRLRPSRTRPTRTICTGNSLEYQQIRYSSRSGGIGRRAGFKIQ